jgi:carbohydrate esterase-like sialic acid-specific acetylesterase
MATETPPSDVVQVLNQIYYSPSTASIWLYGGSGVWTKIARYEQALELISAETSETTAIVEGIRSDFEAADIVLQDQIDDKVAITDLFEPLEITYAQLDASHTKYTNLSYANKPVIVFDKSGNVLVNPTNFTGFNSLGELTFVSPLPVSGDHWVVLGALGTLANYVTQAELFNQSNIIPSGTLVTAFTNGYWRGGQSSPNNTSSVFKRSTNLIPVTQGDILVWYGIDNTIAAGGDIGIRYRSDQTGSKVNVSFILPLPSGGGGYYYVVQAGYVNYGMTIVNADLGTARVVKATGTVIPIDDGKIKMTKIPSGVVQREYLFNIDEGLPNLSQIVGVGSRWSASGSNYPVTIDAAYSRADYFPITTGEKIAIKGLVLSLANGSIGRLFTSTGVPIGAVTPAMLSAKEDYHVLIIPAVTGNTVASIGLQYTASEAQSVIVNLGDTIMLPSIKIKPVFLTDTEEDTESLPTQSDIEALQLYHRGESKKYYSGVYGIIASGQSNQDGRAPIGTLPVGLPSTLTGVKLFNRTTGLYADAQLGVNTGATPNTRSEWAYDWGVYYRLQAYKSANIYVAKRSEGSIPLGAEINGTAAPGSFNVVFEKIDKTSGSKNTKELEQTFLQARDKAVSDAVAVWWKCALWMQGETDRASFKAIFATSYKQNLKNWSAYTRGFANNSILPIIVLGIHKDNEYYDATVRAAQMSLARRKYTWNATTSTLDYAYDPTAEDEFTYFYNMDAHPFTSIGDNVHMNFALNELVAVDIFNIIKDF